MQLAIDLIVIVDAPICKSNSHKVSSNLIVERIEIRFLCDRREIIKTMSEK